MRLRNRGISAGTITASATNFVTARRIAMILENFIETGRNYVGICAMEQADLRSLRIALRSGTTSTNCAVTGTGTIGTVTGMGTIGMDTGAIIPVIVPAGGIGGTDDKHS